MSLGTDEAANRQTNGTQVLVWDLLVRVGHWLLVVLFFVAYFTEDDLLTIHSWAGYGVGIYLIVRIVWGFVGPKHARFSDFAYGPTRAAQYLKDLILFQSKRYLGHTPAGALMIFTLLNQAQDSSAGVGTLAPRQRRPPEKSERRIRFPNRSIGLS